MFQKCKPMRSYCQTYIRNLPIHLEWNTDLYIFFVKPNGGCVLWIFTVCSSAVAYLHTSTYPLRTLYGRCSRCLENVVAIQQRMHEEITNNRFEVYFMYIIHIAIYKYYESFNTCKAALIVFYWLFYCLLLPLYQSVTANLPISLVHSISTLCIMLAAIAYICIHLDFNLCAFVYCYFVQCTRYFNWHILIQWAHKHAIKQRKTQACSD